MPNLVDRLNAEWTFLAAEPPDVVDDWADLCPPLSGCTSLADTLAAIRRSPDETMTFLITCHQAGEHLAGRVVLQSMLGKLVRMSYSAMARREPHPLDDLVTQMWCQVDTYSLHRRPHRIAANLALDTLKAVQREWLRNGEISIPPVEAAVQWEYQQARQPTPDFDWEGDLLIDLAYRNGLITKATRDILNAMYGTEGLTGRAAAERYGCTAAAIRRRCSTAIRDKVGPYARQLAA